MKKILSQWAAVIMGASLSLAQQATPPGPGDRNPYLIQGEVAPAPMLPAEFNGTGQLSFDIGNTGSDSIVWVTGQEMGVTVTLSFGKPNVADPESAVDALNAIGGPGAAFFTWVYDPSIRTFSGTQKADLPGGMRETITIDYKVVENSFSNNSFQNGFNVNISPPGYTNPQPTDDDTVASYTFVEAFDFADAPVSYGDPRHVIDLAKTSGSYNRFLYLGSAIDPEAATQNSSDATGDDTNQTGGLGVDDEDGVVFPLMIAGTTVDLPITFTLWDYDPFGAVVPGVRIRGWIDWGKDGTFATSGTEVAFDDNDINSFLENEDAWTGPRTFTRTVSVAVPADASGSYFMRMRIGPNTNPTNTTSPYGEVEDHTFEIFTPPSKSATFAGFLADNAALFGLDDNSLPGVPNIDPLTGVASDPPSTDTDGDDFGGGSGLTGNADGDVYGNLLEFALCFDPGSGAKVFPDGTRNEGFHLELNGSSLDAKFNKPDGVTDVTYEVQQSTDGQTWTTFTAITPVEVDGPVNGSKTVCYEGIDTSAAGLLRLKVTGTGAVGSTVSAVTGPVGWQTATIKDFCQTYADPLLEPCLVTGTISGVTTGTGVLDLTQAAGSQSLTAVLTPGSNYYVEIMSGDQAGHRFDIASFTDDSLTLAADSDLCGLTAPFNTRLDFPADLAGDLFVIREHKTLEGLFPIDDIDTAGTVEGFTTGTNTSNSGVLLRFDRADGSLESYIADSVAGPDGESWVATTTGPGAPGNILPPGEGIFVHNLLGAAEFDILQYGEVRTNEAAVPLCEGYNFVAPAHPIVAQSIDGGDSTSRLLNADNTDGKFVFEGSGARSLADQVQFWDDDNAPDASSVHICYQMIFYLRDTSGSVDQWSIGGTPSATNEEGKGLFLPTRSAMYCIQKDDMPGYYLPSPISNAVN